MADLDVNLQRKFIDLLFTPSGKYANWEPTKKVYIGDYGRVDEISGRFLLEGNIFENGLYKFKDSEGNERELTKKRADRRDDEHKFNSERVAELSFSGNIGAELQAIAECEFKWRWSFSTGRGAVLVIHKPQLEYIGNEAYLEARLNTPPLNKPDTVIVVEATYSQAYAFMLSRETAGEAAIALSISVPVTQVPALSASAEVKPKWITHSNVGSFKHGSGTKDDDFCPMFLLGRLADARHWAHLRHKTRVYTTTPKRTGDDEEPLDRPVAAWCPPWGDLGEDGEVLSAPTYTGAHDAEAVGSSSGIDER